MSLHNLDELRKEYTLIKTNQDAVKKWILANKHFTINDLAQIMELSAERVRIKRRKMGIHGRKTMNNPIYPHLPARKVDLPKNWKTKEWLTKAVAVHSINQIAIAAKRNRREIKHLLRIFNIKYNNTVFDAGKSKNKCCTHAWCYKHYVTLRLSQTECAKLAGIARQTFIGWLNRFKIPVRTKVESNTGKINTSISERKLVLKLKQQPIVKHVLSREGLINVRLRNSLSDTYYVLPTTKKPCYNRIKLADFKLENVPLIYHEYGYDIYGEPIFPAHIAISRTDLNNSSILEQRMAIHEFTRQIITRGWIWPKFPQQTIEDDFAMIKELKLDNYRKGNIYTTLDNTPTAHIGRKIMMHFFDLKQFYGLLKKPSMTFRLLNWMLEKTRTRINLFHLMLHAAANEGKFEKRYRHTVKIQAPGLHYTIFKNLGLEGTMLDVSIGLGERAVACAAAGMSYTTPDQDFDDVIERGFLQFTKMPYQQYRGQDVDVVVYDEGNAKPIMDKVIPYIHKTKKLLVFSPAAYKDEVLGYNPKSAIRLRTRLYNKNPDYLFIW